MRAPHLIAVLALALIASSGAGAQSLDEIRKDFDAGNYRPALQKISSALATTGYTMPKEQTYELLMLRGESLLRIKERTYAIDAFNAAVRTAPDITRAAQAKADAVIITRSQGSLYRPADGGEPVNIVPPDSRKLAMQAAFSDGLRRDTPRLKAALEGKELPPMLDLVPALVDLYVLEYASTGEPRKTLQILKGFGEHARALMNAELDRLARRIQGLGMLANSTVSSNYGWGSDLDRRGLWTPERNELRDLIAYIDRIRQAALKGRQIATSFGATGENWDPVIADADNVLEQANELWQHRY
jgi:tetratricopeptide (TPR) repeat protein